MDSKKTTCETVQRMHDKKYQEIELIKSVKEFLKSTFIVPSRISNLNKILFERYDVNVVKFETDYDVYKFTFMLKTNLSDSTHCISVDILK